MLEGIIETGMKKMLEQVGKARGMWKGGVEEDEPRTKWK